MNKAVRKIKIIKNVPKNNCKECDFCFISYGICEAFGKPVKDFKPCRECKLAEINNLKNA